MTENIVLHRHAPLWRLIQGISFLIGGTTFIAGSCMYFPSVYATYSDAFLAGGWLFIVGSAGFLIANAMELWYYRVGCLSNCRLKKEPKEMETKLFVHPANSFCGFYERSVSVLNAFVSFCGSTLYLVGSIYFLPSFSSEVLVGDWLFIIGSAFIFCSQAWKIIQSASNNPDNHLDRRFHCGNIFHHPMALLTNLFTGFGGVLYFVGTIYFLPSINETDTDGTRAAILFVCGGISFTLAGILLQFIHFTEKKESSDEVFTIRL